MMDIEEYNKIIEKQIDVCKNLLISKRVEYSPNANPIHNFISAAALTNKSTVGALGGMMAKHTISVYDMIDRSDKGEKFADEKWEEKITDSINYLLLLRVLLANEK